MPSLTKIVAIAAVGAMSADAFVGTFELVDACDILETPIVPWDRLGLGKEKIPASQCSIDGCGIMQI